MSTKRKANSYRKKTRHIYVHYRDHVEWSAKMPRGQDPDDRPVGFGRRGWTRPGYYVNIDFTTNQHVVGNRLFYETGSRMIPRNWTFL